MKKNLSSAAWVRFATLVGLLTVTPFAHAHPGHGPLPGFGGGFAHPLLGLDHLLAMVAVGLWAAQLGGAALWRVPASFVALMVVGGLAGAFGAAMPGVEEWILVSVLVLGILIVAAVRPPLWLSMGVVGLFAFFHGHAHGSEVAAAASAIPYGLGFVLATALLHAAGIGLAGATERMAGRAIRWAGAAVLAGGLWLCLV